MIIDYHHHPFDEPDYYENLLKTMDELGIERCVLSGLGKEFGMKDDDSVLKAIKKWPDRFIGFIYFRLGKDTLDKIKYYFEYGFKGVKFTCPLKNYNDESFFEIYDFLEENNMPTLFHTGIVNASKASVYSHIDSAKMQVIYLDGIARRFPRLKIVAAHIGVQDPVVATTIARILPNVYVDITGAIDGWRKVADKEFFKKIFFWKNAFEKVIFGTDVHYKEMKRAMEYDLKLYEELNLSEEIVKKVMGETARKWLKV